MKDKIEFKRDEDGNLVAYKNGKKIGKVSTTGDNVNSKASK